MPVRPCAECESNQRAPGKARCVGCIDAGAQFDFERKLQADWLDRERRRQRVALEDCETCAYRNGDRCAYYPPSEGKQPLAPGRCNYWLPVADADPKPGEAADDEADADPEPGEADDEADADPEPGDDDASYVLSVDGAASAARDYQDDEYEEYDGYRPGNWSEIRRRRR